MKTIIKNPWQEALEYGIDIDHLKSNLKLGYDQRIQQHEEALKLFLLLRQAHKDLYGKNQSTAQDPTGE